VTLPLIRDALGEQARRERDHLPDVGMRPRLDRRLRDPQRAHVPVEVELLDRGKPVVGRAGPVRGG
jgi:hypothetical protein